MLAQLQLSPESTHLTQEDEGAARLLKLLGVSELTAFGQSLLHRMPEHIAELGLLLDEEDLQRAREYRRNSRTGLETLGYTECRARLMDLYSRPLEKEVSRSYKASKARADAQAPGLVFAYMKEHALPRPPEERLAHEALEWLDAERRSQERHEAHLEELQKVLARIASGNRDPEAKSSAESHSATPFVRGLDKEPWTDSHAYRHVLAALPEDAWDPGTPGVATRCFHLKSSRGVITVYENNSSTGSVQVAEMEAIAEIPSWDFGGMREFAQSEELLAALMPTLRTHAEGARLVLLTGSGYGSVNGRNRRLDSVFAVVDVQSPYEARVNGRFVERRRPQLIPYTGKFPDEVFASSARAIWNIEPEAKDWAQYSGFDPTMSVDEVFAYIGSKYAGYKLPKKSYKVAGGKFDKFLPEHLAAIAQMAFEEATEEVERDSFGEPQLRVVDGWTPKDLPNLDPYGYGPYGAYTLDASGDIVAMRVSQDRGDLIGFDDVDAQGTNSDE